MLKTQKNNVQKIFKGAVLGVACVLSLSAVPFASLQSASTSAASVESGNPSISVSEAAKTVVKGSEYQIKKGKYVNGSTSEDVVVGDTAGTVKTDITVKYKNSNLKETINESSATGIAGTFVPSLVGTYTITYTVQDGDKEFSYDYDVVCEISDASFEFESNDKNVLPSVYDLSIAGGKDVVLPLPKVLDADGEEIKVKDGDEERTLNFYTAKDKNTIPETEKEYVLIAVSGITGIEDGFSYNNETKQFVISGETLKNSQAGTCRIDYRYYQNGQFVTSTTKSFDLSKSYYKVEDKDGANAGYTLRATFATSRPDKASTGVALPLPTIKATTDAKNSPSSESINVSYSVKISKRNSNNNFEEITDTTGILDTVKNTFTAPSDGDYKFDYTVVDFYGNTVTENLSFRINGVKDDIAPTVYVFDGKDAESLEKDEDGNTIYTSAINAIKSRTSNRNMVIYAIGANDNVKDKDIELTRVIRDASGTTRFTIDDQAYKNYNLIFNFGKKDGDDSVGPYKQFILDNAYVARNMQNASTATEEEIAAFLKENNYLIVTHKAEDKPATDEAKTALIERGYAYVENAGEHVFSTQTYSLIYSAKDAAGNSAESDPISMYVTTDKQYTDKTTPKITFSTSLQDTYLPDQSFKFAVPKASDDEDRNVELFVGYRLLKSTKTGGNYDVVANVEGEETVTFETNENSVVANKWYGTQGTHTAQFVLPEANSNGEYKIDLAPLTTAHTDASFVEILVYGIDDYGNIGFFNKIIKIAAQNDTKAPSIVAGSIDTFDSENASVKQGEKITLPKIIYTDDLVDYMTTTVEVYYVTKTTTGEGAEAVTTKNYKAMPSENASTTVDSFRQRYVLNAGSFTASYAGHYQVKVTVKDAGNNSIATFFDYEVAQNGSTVEDVVIDNITSETITLEVGKTHQFPAPTLKVNETDTTGYYGVAQDDDAKTATYYTATAVSAETNFYDLTKTEFTARAAGTYEIEFNVYVIEYKKGADVTIDENGRLIYKGTHAIFVDMEAETPSLIAVKVSELPAGDADTTFDFTGKGFELHPLKSDAQKIKVTDTTNPVLNIDGSEYVPYQELNKEIMLQRISATENAAAGINPEKSNVLVTISKASGNSDVERIYMKDWDNARNSGGFEYKNGQIYLKLVENGNYRIEYTAVDYAGNTATQTFTFGNGDTEKPVIKDNAGFLNKDKDSYAVNDTLRLDITKLEFSDNQTSAETLASSDRLEIKVTNKDTNKVIDAIEGISYNYNLTTAGNYEISIKTRDDAGWTTEKLINITVSAKAKGDIQTVYRVVGTVLIVLSALILVGVIAYFVASKVKLDKELKGTSKKKNKKK